MKPAMDLRVRHGGRKPKGSCICGWGPMPDSVMVGIEKSESNKSNQEYEEPPVEYEASDQQDGDGGLEPWLYQ
ncbi:hypothetical protein RHMOL_Rhmol10G0176800 [Rhododendron molle]|uniref:Uncharacterized protein n=1 Tax=Rhododendron molle TaxID=49168 RepID=A0ACC0M3I8_RHOML|nr:hypothetical protein RHMOL_Rhmol10G0176800 [Rhododendron molle]